MPCNRSLSVSAAALVSLLALSACQQQSTAPAAEETSAVPHGYVEGAEEADEPQLRLASLDTETGTLTLVDLVSEEVVTEVENAPGTSLAAADQRYLYLTDQDAGAARIVDSGVWTVDHGDHKHYYRAEPSVVGDVPGTDPAHVVAHDSAVAFFFDGDGAARVYDRSPLGDGELTELNSVEPGPHHGVAVPLGDDVLSTVPADATDDLPSEVVAYGPDGTATPLPETCTELHGTAATRAGVLFACEDGVLQVDEDLNAELLPYPDEADGERAWSLSAGREVVAAAAGDAGILILDADSGQWHTVSTDAPVTSLDVAPDDSVVVALDEHGTGYAVDAGNGEVLAQSELLADAGSGDGHGSGPSVVVDRERTYVSDPAGGRVLELDAADGLREARVLELGGHPSSLAVTGR
ncbi:PQQ-binding-like beta-propeller repeat protein [Sediminivirga luteola]|uniref:Lipoprotein n=1 Tax=Sediminivirga luteola TaxID=1774748 RepID=A0A8J2TVS0_9MICO|nr:PQQ-binding-like beta-propeller repeat protein [Sediminivirga luteola]GGA04896.1 lipoprotein [Sediminivirga luteola]